MTYTKDEDILKLLYSPLIDKNIDNEIVKTLYYRNSKANTIDNSKSTFKTDDPSYTKEQLLGLRYLIKDNNNSFREFGFHYSFGIREMDWLNHLNL